MSNQQKPKPTSSGVNIKTNTRTVNITNVYVNKAPSQKKHYPTEQKNKTAPVKNNQPAKPHSVVKQPTTVNNFYNVTLGGNSKTKIQQNNINVPRSTGPKPQMQHGTKTVEQQTFTKPQHPRPQQNAQHAKPQQQQPKPKMHNPNKAGQAKQVTITNVYNVTLAPSDQKHLAMALKLGNLSLSKP